MSRTAITRINGGLEIVSNPSTTSNNGFYAPQLSAAQRGAITVSDGAIIYNTTTLLFEIHQNGEWSTLTSASVDVGEGLDAGSPPVVIPSGAKAAVEVVANELDGFIYYDTTNTVLTARVNGAWLVIATV
jgi:hypothetical protein